MEKYVLVNLLNYSKEEKTIYLAELYLSDGKHSGNLMTLFIDEKTFHYLIEFVPIYSDVTDLIKIRYNSYSKKYQAVIYINN